MTKERYNRVEEGYEGLVAGVLERARRDWTDRPGFYSRRRILKFVESELFDFWMGAFNTLTGRGDDVEGDRKRFLEQLVE